MIVATADTSSPATIRSATASAWSTESWETRFENAVGGQVLLGVELDVIAVREQRQLAGLDQHQLGCRTPVPVGSAVLRDGEQPSAEPGLAAVESGKGTEHLEPGVGRKIVRQRMVLDLEVAKEARLEVTPDSSERLLVTSLRGGQLPPEILHRCISLMIWPNRIPSPPAAGLLGESYTLPEGQSITTGKCSPRDARRRLGV